ncbi:hypothetical protein [Brachyspira aalborgi]|uniref:hypothetical protein n=1 Tax=Brachyspira aalborgi TaxID=29522 RepID=UPI0026661641|nr:hypothetical protein [Brachyspira aalborgi]
MIIAIVYSLSLFSFIRFIQFKDMASGWDVLGMMLCIAMHVEFSFFHKTVNKILFKQRMKKVENEKSEEEKLAKFKSLCPNKDKSKKLSIISFVCWAIILIISLFTFRGSGKYIDLVKNGAFQAYPDITIEELINGAMYNPKWKQGQTEDGINFVNVSGLIEGNKVVIQFKIHKNENSWEVNALEINGQPMSKQGIARDLYNLYIANK